MSDARIKEIESEIGDLENEQGELAWTIDKAKDAIMQAGRRHGEIELKLQELSTALNNEPFDELI